MLTIDNIACILKVAECLSINKASEFLYKTPSQISRIVKGFEDVIGLTIFERTNKGLILTEDGEVVIQYCKALIQNYQNILDYSAIQTEANKYSGMIDFYTSSNVQTNIYAALTAFNEKYPNVVVNSHTVSSENVIQNLVTQKNALGFLAQIYTESSEPYYALPSELQYTALTYHDSICLLCNKNGTLAKTSKTIYTRALANLPLIDYKIYNDAPSYTSTLLEALDVDIQRFRYVVDDLRTLTQFLEKNLGYYVGIYSDSAKLSDQITGIPIKSNISAEAGLVIKQNSKNELCMLLHDFLKNWYGDLYAPKRLVAHKE